MRRLEFETFSVDHVDQLRCLLLHLDHEAFDPAAKVAEEDPISGLIVAIVPSVVKKRSSSCATALPASSIASFMTSRELL